MTPQYIPQPGTIPYRVIAYLKERPGEFVAATVLADEMGQKGNISAFMVTAEAMGAVIREKREGRVYFAVTQPDFSARYRQDGTLHLTLTDGHVVHLNPLETRLVAACLRDLGVQG